MKPLPGEIVISKTSSSAFNSTAIDQMLPNLGIQYLIACGVVTNGCVDLTVRDAADRNYRVIVAHDACAAMSPQIHQAALLCLDGFVGMVKSAVDRGYAQAPGAHTPDRRSQALECPRLSRVTRPAGVLSRRFHRPVARLGPARHVARRDGEQQAILRVGSAPVP